MQPARVVHVGETGNTFFFVIHAHTPPLHPVKYNTIIFCACMCVLYSQLYIIADGFYAFHLVAK